DHPAWRGVQALPDTEPAARTFVHTRECLRRTWLPGAAPLRARCRHRSGQAHPRHMRRPRRLIRGGRIRLGDYLVRITLAVVPEFVLPLRRLVIRIPPR